MIEENKTLSLDYPSLSLLSNYCKRRDGKYINTNIKHKDKVLDTDYFLKEVYECVKKKYLEQGINLDDYFQYNENDDKYHNKIQRNTSSNSSNIREYYDPRTGPPPEPGPYASAADALAYEYNQHFYNSYKKNGYW
jgi:hypothetical protein